MKKSYIIVLAMSELNRELADVMRDLKAEPDFKYLQNRRNVIEVCPLTSQTCFQFPHCGETVI